MSYWWVGLNIEYKIIRRKQNGLAKAPLNHVNSGVVFFILSGLNSGF